ncbi:YafY family protein [Phenylobacterium sp.]|uniref:helix-turn-helix transcriptional regulator n=1 Tax=Phenylobacterium sp. TaxID=1871053 RepID=UPI0028124DF6|nr:YafY family protein [Phenylobacterium sp.]
MLASRLLSILLTLQARGRVTAKALAEQFEVSVRTIYRDIDELSAAGVPVYAEKGRNGGFALLDGYRTRLTGLDRPEAEALLLAGLPGAAAQLGLGEALARTRLKLMAALPEAARDDAERVAQRFHLDPVSWFQAPDEHRILPELALAVWSGRTVRLRYDSWKAVVEREVAPLGLVLKAGLWYLVAAVDGAPRTYRVASILDFEVGEPASPAADFDLAAYWAKFRDGYEARMQALTATVRASPEALRVLARASQAAASAVQRAAPPDAAGWREVEIPIESETQAVWELLRLGPRIEVLEPASLRERLKAAAAEVSALYA